MGLALSQPGSGWWAALAWNLHSGWSLFILFFPRAVLPPGMLFTVTSDDGFSYRIFLSSYSNSRWALQGPWMIRCSLLCCQPHANHKFFPFPVQASHSFSMQQRCFELLGREMGQSGATVQNSLRTPITHMATHMALHCGLQRPSWFGPSAMRAWVLLSSLDSVG